MIRRREFITLLGGAAATWPLAVRAQQAAMPVIGFMSSRSPEDSEGVVAAFRKGLSEGGLVEGRNVLLEFRWARGEYNRLPSLAAELVNQSVTVLVAAGGEASALTAKAATSTIPIIFISSDPVKSGLVASLNRPGGNATGFHFITTDLESKRLGLLDELFPGTAILGGLVNPKSPPASAQAVEINEAARKLGRTVILLNATTDSELNAVFGSLSQRHVTAMLVAADPFFDTRRDQLILLAAKYSDRRARELARGRSTSSGPQRSVIAGAAGIGVDRWPQRADRLPLGRRQCRAHSQGRGGIGRARAGRPPGSGHLDPGAATAGDARCADRVRPRRRSGRRRLCREPRSPRREYHRIYQSGIRRQREMAGAAQAARAARHASGGAARFHSVVRYRPVRRHPGRGTVIRCGGEPGQRAQR